ncbi:MAG: DUF3791 domain-containing protein [Bacteroidales bacterium]|nr:DUF3791 domain-containing protein [Bacteroidales bacterium]
MKQKEKDIIEYIVCCISEFGNVHKIAMHQAYEYLSKFGGLDFLRKFYNVEHTFSVEDAIEDITMICHRNGGEFDESTLPWKQCLD